MEPLVYIVIINYNNYEDTIECINSLREISYKNYKIVVVDNNSANQSVDILNNAFLDVEIVQAGKNLGFAGGCNIGINLALENRAEYVLLINNDTVVDKDFLAEMISSFKNNNSVGIVGGKIYNYYNKNLIDSAGGYVDFFRFVTVNYSVSQEIPRCEQEADYISGCLMLIKTEIFHKVGVLPEEYFMYYEDTDFCVKVKESGYKILCNSRAIIYHKISKSSGGESSSFAIKYNVRNRLIFMRKYKYKISKIKYFAALLYFYITRFVRIILYFIKGDTDRANAIIEGIKEGKNFIKRKAS